MLELKGFDVAVLYSGGVFFGVCEIFALGGVTVPERHGGIGGLGRGMAFGFQELMCMHFSGDGEDQILGGGG